MKCSSTLQQIDVREMDLYLEASPRLPFLYIGQMLIVSQSDGRLPFVNYSVNITSNSYRRDFFSTVF